MDLNEVIKLLAGKDEHISQLLKQNGNLHDELKKLQEELKAQRLLTEKLNA